MKNKVFFILGGGGHTAQMLILQRDFPDQQFDKHFILANTDVLSEKKLLKLGYRNIHKVDRYKETEESLVVATARNLFRLGLVKQISQSFAIVGSMDGDILISAGPNTGFLVFILARLKGNFCVYIESWSRRKKLSKSGRLLKNFSNMFFVQWPELREKHKSALYKGRLM